MGFRVIKGTFHVLGYSPDGDSIRFKADNESNWAFLTGPTVKLNARRHAQLRLEAIDTLETHFGNLHQPMELATAALTFLLDELGITNVEWNAPFNTTVTAADDAVEGYIISRAVESNRRPVAFAFTGAPPEQDGAPIFLTPARLRESVNYKSVRNGLAYPTYYKGLFSDLRSEISNASQHARQANLGVWARDVTSAGFEVNGLQDITEQHVILPKLFRRLAEYLENGGNVAGFDDYMRARREGVMRISDSHFTHFDTYIEVQGNIVRMTEPPENLIFQGS